jgi:small subunit ribosomal protein S1
MEHSVEEVSTTEIKTKMRFMGKVVKIGLAGAMLELEGGRHGLLHISQLVASNDQPIKRVEDVLKEGQEIEVWVKKVVKQDGEDRVELTMVKPLDLEWRDIKKGMTVKGKVVRLEKFGAFVEIGAERPGLVHISEMAHGYVRTPGDVVNEGDEIEAEVIDVNRRKKQIKLSMKALLPEPVKVEEAPRPAASEPARRERPSGTSASINANAPVRRKKITRKPKTEDGTDNSALVDSYSEPAEAEPTALGIALMEAMERAKTKKKQSDDKVHRSKVMTQEQEEILTRTLDNKPNS